MVALLIVCVALPSVAAADSRVAESTVMPDRLIQSHGRINYNYDVHAVEMQMDGERVMMYRYRWIPLHPPVTREVVEREIQGRDAMDSKDAVTLEGKAPLCDKTKVPRWGGTGFVEKLEAETDPKIVK